MKFRRVLPGCWSAEQVHPFNFWGEILNSEKNCAWLHYTMLQVTWSSATFADECCSRRQVLCKHKAGASHHSKGHPCWWIQGRLQPPPPGPSPYCQVDVCGHQNSSPAPPPPFHFTSVSTPEQGWKKATFTKAVESGITLSKLAIEFAGQASMCVESLNIQGCSRRVEQIWPTKCASSMPDQSKFGSSTTVLHNIAYTSCMLVVLMFKRKH